MHEGWFSTSTYSGQLQGTLLMTMQMQQRISLPLPLPLAENNTTTTDTLLAKLPQNMTTCLYCPYCISADVSSREQLLLLLPQSPHTIFVPVVHPQFPVPMVAPQSIEVGLGGLTYVGPVVSTRGAEGAVLA